MAITVSAQSKSSYTPIPAGVYSSICIAIIDLGTQEVTWNGTAKLQKKIMITWEIPEVTITVDGEEKPRVISKEYTRSLDERSRLRPMLESWRGKSFTDSELELFDLANVLGAACTLQILHTTKGDRTYANIASIMPHQKGMPLPPSETEKIYFDLEDVSSLSLLDKLPEWIRDKVKKSPEYLNLIGSQIDSTHDDFTELDDDGDLPF